MEIFSGEYSRKMWDQINNSETVEDLQDALYLVCCRLQEFETKLASTSPNKKLQTDACNLDHEEINECGGLTYCPDCGEELRCGYQY
jgi:hypothetical protein